MSVAQMLLRVLPGLFARIVNGLPVFFVTELRRIALKSSPAGAFPRRDVQRQFPDRVRAGNRMCSSLRGCHSVEQCEHRWSMPCFSIKRAPKLIANAIHFRDR